MTTPIPPIKELSYESWRRWFNNKDDPELSDKDEFELLRQEAEKRGPLEIYAAIQPDGRVADAADYKETLTSDVLLAQCRIVKLREVCDE